MKESHTQAPASQKYHGAVIARVGDPGRDRPGSTGKYGAALVARRRSGSDQEQGFQVLDHEGEADAGNHGTDEPRTNCLRPGRLPHDGRQISGGGRSEEHTSELQSLMR